MYLFVVQLCPTLCDPMDCSNLGFPVLHCLLEFTQTHVESMMPSNYFILCHPPSPPDLNIIYIYIYIYVGGGSACVCVCV